MTNQPTNPMTDQSYKERAEKAEAACAEMRALIRPIDLLSGCSCELCNKIRHALSSDCGKGWMAPEKVQKLLGLIDGAKIAVELFPASPSQVQWRKRWLEDARQALEETK